jgi:hypothetical protein
MNIFQKYKIKFNAKGANKNSVPEVQKTGQSPAMKHFSMAYSDCDKRKQAYLHF